MSTRRTTSFYGANSRVEARRRPRTRSVCSPVQYGPGMLLSDHPDIPNNDLSDIENELAEPSQQYSTPPFHPVDSFHSREIHCSGSRIPSDHDPREQYLTPSRSFNHQESASSRGSSMIVLFQQQQALLQKLMAAQESMTEKQEVIESKLNLLEKDHQERHESGSNSSGNGKRKQIITLSLSVS